ncbi:hypothetical protein C484_10576 [Natrialba taiwanensis DSM 12281]|uniref:Phage head morphogenesis domain-containing protein n=1 Tax=Natrialba taiwanensis DSM 12281 TaxID=1230458 RepID=L9ZZG8_9EURY|nr:hypothetical protein C484_10576 [Natrialba taiwanensis DSM 12281]
MVKRKTNPRTQITEIQKAFESDIYHRLIRDSDGEPLSPEIRERVVEEDALGLETIQLQFEFPENPEAAADFEDWLDGKIRSDVLESASRRQVVDGRHYSSDYLYQSSQQGVKHSHRELRRAGVDLSDEDTQIGTVLRTPVHEDILSSAYVRAYDELDNITSEMSTEISRVMSDSLAEGVNPRETARRMTDRVDVGLTRGRRIARTETARTYNLHSAARYSDLGVTEVRILTANPCDRCVDLRESGPYPIEEAGSLLPEHPNCVCSLAPITETMQ